MQAQDTISNAEPVSPPLLLSQPRLPALPPAQGVQVAEIKVPVVPVMVSSATPSTSSSHGSGGGGSAPVATVAPALRLDDITLPDGRSVWGKAATVGLTPDVMGTQPLVLTLKGQFDTQPPLTLEQVRLTQVNNLQWQPVGVSPTAIQLQLNPQFRTDLKLVGPQTVDIQVGGLVQRTQIKVGPGPTVFTYPELLSAQVAGNQLTLTGRWLMNNPKFQQLKVNQVVVPVQGVQMDGQGVYTLTAQVPDGVLGTEGNGVQVATPFGMAYREVGK